MRIGQRRTWARDRPNSCNPNARVSWVWDNGPVRTFAQYSVPMTRLMMHRWKQGLSGSCSAARSSSFSTLRISSSASSFWEREKGPGMCRISAGAKHTVTSGHKVSVLARLSSVLPHPSPPVLPASLPVARTGSAHPWTWTHNEQLGCTGPSPYLAGHDVRDAQVGQHDGGDANEVVRVLLDHRLVVADGLLVVVVLHSNTEF